jgi:hypothetical protein
MSTPFGKIYFCKFNWFGSGECDRVLLIVVVLPNQLPALIAIMPVLAGTYRYSGK